MQGVDEVDKNKWLGKRKQETMTEYQKGKKNSAGQLLQEAGPGEHLEKPRLKGSCIPVNRETERT